MKWTEVTVEGLCVLCVLVCKCVRWEKQCSSRVHVHWHHISMNKTVPVSKPCFLLFVCMCNSTMDVYESVCLKKTTKKGLIAWLCRCKTIICTKGAESNYIPNCWPYLPILRVAVFPLLFVSSNSLRLCDSLALGYKHRHTHIQTYTLNLQAAFPGTNATFNKTFIFSNTGIIITQNILCITHTTQVHSPRAVQRCRKLRQWLLVLLVGGGTVFWIMITLVTLSECKIYIVYAQTRRTVPPAKRHRLS